MTDHIAADQSGISEVSLSQVSTEQYRDAFEKDTLEVFSAARFGRFPLSGRYNIDWIQNRWEGWQAALSSNAAQSAGQEPVGVTVNMPGTCGGVTMAAFKSEDVPIGMKLYTHPSSAAQVAALTKSLEEMVELAEACDSWQSFPQAPIDRANAALKTAAPSKGEGS